MGKYTNSGVGKRSPNAENHWKQLDIAKVRIKKPTLICLGGNGTTDDTVSKDNSKLVCGSERANGVCAIAERLIGLKPEEPKVYSTYAHVDFISFHYGKDSPKDKIGKFSEDELKKIVKFVFLPLCLDNNLKPLPVDEVCKNISLITFFTHCHGAREVANILNMYKYCLIKLGYTESEVQKIYSSIFHISYSPLTDETLTPTLKLESFMDVFNIGLDQIFEETYGYKLNGIATIIDKKGTLRNKQYSLASFDNITVYSSKLVNKQGIEALSEPNEHGIDCLDRNKKWESKSGAKNADVVSKIAGYTIARSIARSLEIYEKKILLPPITVDELKEEYESLMSIYTIEELAR